MAILEEEFMTNPVSFLRAHPLSPPNGSPDQSPLKTWVVPDSVVESGSVVSAKFGIHKAGIAKKYAKVVKHAVFPGCLTFELGDAVPNPAPHPTRRSAIPMWWLPWGSNALVRLRIPPVPAVLINPQEDDFPRFFATAGINGCSIMVEGPPEAPTIYHAGIDGKLARPADQFWLEQMGVAQGHFGTVGKNVHGIHSKDYMPKDRAEIKRFIDWQESSMAGGFKLEVTNCFGSVVGLRSGRLWSFYLQENAYTQTVEFLKRDEVEKSSASSGSTKFYVDKQGVGVERQDHMETRKFGLIKYQKKVKTFLRRSNPTTAVIGVGEIYPMKNFRSDFERKITVKS
jgi:hypothetical protein